MVCFHCATVSLWCVSTVLFSVTEKSHLNKMSAVNLASVFGPILMKLDNVRHCYSCIKCKVYIYRARSHKKISIALSASRQSFAQKVVIGCRLKMLRLGAGS